jgi:hypothetical protein
LASGFPVPWLLTYLGRTNISANADPTSASSVLRITGESVSSGATKHVTVT